MCGRYVLAALPEVIALEFDLPDIPDVPARFNIAPSQVVPVVRETRDHRRLLASMRWGLIPFWAKDPAIGNRLINARGESLEGKPSFRTPFQRHRCLIPATGFYEWQHQDDRKQPFFIQRKDEQLFALAGLWSRWHAPDGGTVDTFAIVTTDANLLLANIHDRMPALVMPEDYAAWLDPDNQDTARLRLLLKPPSPDLMEAYPVSTDVNRTRHDDPHLIDRVQPAP